MTPTPSTRRAPSPISTVVFDFGSVLAWPPGRDGFAALADVAGLTTDALVERYYLHRRPYDHGDASPAEYWSSVIGTREIAPDLVERLTAHDADLWTDFNVAARGWIPILRAAGLRIGILSNMPAPFADHLLARYDWLLEMDVHVFSGHVHLSKPERAIYDLFISRLEASPRSPTSQLAAPLDRSSVLFLDDLEGNVRAAREAGLSAEVYTVYRGGLAAIAAAWGLPAPPEEPPVTPERRAHEAYAPHNHAVVVAQSRE